MKLASELHKRSTGNRYILDEPTWDFTERTSLAQGFSCFVDDGNTVPRREHNLDATRTPEEVAANEASYLGPVKERLI